MVRRKEPYGPRGVPAHSAWCCCPWSWRPAAAARPRRPRPPLARAPRPTPSPTSTAAGGPRHPEASRTAVDQVADLRALLDAAGVSGPFVIGAHSYGATVAILFTQAYRDEVVGLLFVAPESPRASARFR